MKLKKILSLCLAGIMALSVTGCVNQHPEETSSTNESGEIRLVATSPAVAQICNRLNLDLVGICQSTSDLPERYDGVTTVGMAMNPDLEIIKSLDPDYILSPQLPAKRPAAQIRFHRGQFPVFKPQKRRRHVRLY